MNFLYHSVSVEPVFTVYMNKFLSLLHFWKITKVKRNNSWKKKFRKKIYSQNTGSTYLSRRKKYIGSSYYLQAKDTYHKAVWQL